MTRKTEGVRIGPISLVTLISILLLAVLAMLCVTSANAAQTMAERQAASTTETYALDSCGQNAVAAFDARLAKTKSLKSATKHADSIIRKAAKDAHIVSPVIGITRTTSDTLGFSITTDDGKSLEAKISDKNGTLVIDKWKLTTKQQETEESLWQASDNQ